MIDDYRAETIDVVPTIAGVLDLEIPWQVDGVSLVSDDRPDRAESTMRGPKGSVTFGADGSEVREAAAWLTSWFPGGDPWALAPAGHGILLGRPLDETDVVEWDRAGAVVDRSDRYRDMDLDGEPFPALMTGRVVFPTNPTGSEIVAVSVDGVIRGVTRVFDPVGPRASFQVMLPPSAFQTPNPDIEVLIVPEDGGPLVRATRF